MSMMKLTSEIIIDHQKTNSYMYFLQKRFYDRVTNCVAFCAIQWLSLKPFFTYVELK